jgi:hypothetical protein
MLSHEIRETQFAIELPAREMLAAFNWASVYTRQTNFNAQLGLLNINVGQANVSSVGILQGAED